MDETMAIERFLSGNEVSVWSQVSKKKKPAPRSVSRGYIRDRRDRDRNHHLQDQESPDPSNSAGGYRRGPRHHPHKNKDYANAPDPTAAAKKRALVSWGSPTEQATSDTDVLLHETLGKNYGTGTEAETMRYQILKDGGNRDQSFQSHTPAPEAHNWSESGPAVPLSENAWAEPSHAACAVSPWRTQEPAADVVEAPQLEHDPTQVVPSLVNDAPQKANAIPSPSIKRTFNYAAAAAAGTSHARPAPIADLSKSVPISAAIVKLPTDTDHMAEAEAADETYTEETTDSKKRRSRAGRKNRGRGESERPLHETNGSRSVPSSGLATEGFDSRENGMPSATNEVHVDAPGPLPNAWSRTTAAAPAKPSSEKQFGETSAAVAVASATVVGTEQTSGDALNLQFGSFGLSGLDGVNWSASDQKVSEPVSTTLAGEPLSVSSTAAVTSSSTSASMAAKAAPTVGVSSTAMPPSSGRDRANAIEAAVNSPIQTPVSIPMPSASRGTSGSGIQFPILPVGPGGNFPPPNYGAPYLMPPLHGYAPALGSYENAGDLGSSRAPNIGPPGSLPLYDPTALPTMGSGNAKYGGIPGLGEMSGLPLGPSGMGKDSLHGNSDMDKSSIVGSAGLPAGMEALAAPYMVPGYPSMQYPMYTFPNAPYAPPPGMAPPGPSPFPYAPAGQVSTQGARGGFGFEDVGLGGPASRSSSGAGESMYTPGGYLSTSVSHSVGHSGSQKVPHDAPYKQVRGNSHPGSNVGGMSMAGGMIHGMTYGEYPAGSPGIGNGAGISGGGPAGWNNRQPNVGRDNTVSGPGVGNQSIAGGGSQNSTLYATAPGGTHGGYWTPQQGGYYP